MSRHARVEELPDSSSDSDPSEMDPSDFLPTPPVKSSASKAPSQSLPYRQPASTSRLAPSQISSSNASNPAAKTWQCLYPVYFDKSRSRAQGRRVKKSLAVENPLATEIADACSGLGLKVKIEVMSCHPKDWSNIGRVRVELKEGGGGRSKVHNKHHLYILISEYLRLHPTTEQTPLRLPIVPGEKVEVKPPPAIPRGWKMNQILPLHSPAVKGHGVTDNPLREAMAQMGEGGGALPPGMEAMQSMLGGAGGSGTGETRSKKKGKKG